MCMYVCSFFVLADTIAYFITHEGKVAEEYDDAALQEGSDGERESAREREAGGTRPTLWRCAVRGLVVQSVQVGRGGMCVS